jgi:DNA-binding NarL/FixJ family response regulator
VTEDGHQSYPWVMTTELERAPLGALERRALWHVAQGTPGASVARALAISESTLRRVLRRARAEVGANSTINAVYRAARKGWI